MKLEKIAQTMEEKEMNAKKLAQYPNLIVRFKSEGDINFYMRIVRILQKLVAKRVKEVLEARGFEVKTKKKEGITPVYLIKSKDCNVLEFHFQGLFLEIALKDTNATEWEADERLFYDFDYFIEKAGKVTDDKLDCITMLMSNEDHEAIEAAKRLNPHAGLRVMGIVNRRGIHKVKTEEEFLNHHFMKGSCLIVT